MTCTEHGHPHALFRAKVTGWRIPRLIWLPLLSGESPRGIPQPAAQPREVILHEDTTTQSIRCQTPHLPEGYSPQTTVTSLAPFAEVKLWRTRQNYYVMRAFSNMLLLVAAAWIEPRSKLLNTELII